MILCFPVEQYNGINSMVYGHFGSAPMFITYNSDTEDMKVINNRDQNHVHGMCSPIQALNGNIIDAIIVGGIGGGAINKLQSMGIKVYQAADNSVEKNIELFKNNALPEISINNACEQHGGCSH